MLFLLISITFFFCILLSRYIEAGERNAMIAYWNEVFRRGFRLLGRISLRAVCSRLTKEV